MIGQVKRLQRLHLDATYNRATPIKLVIVYCGLLNLNFCLKLPIK